MIEPDDENKKPAGEKKGLGDARRKARDPVKPRYPSTGRPSRGDRRPRCGREIPMPLV